MQSLKFTAILLGALCTNALSYFGGISAVVAAASVALFFAAIVVVWRLKKANDYLPMLYMGTFVGMSNLKSLSVPFAFLTLLVGSIGALILAQMLAKRLIGVGGKLGLIAFIVGVPVMFAQEMLMPGKALSMDGDAVALMAAITVAVLALSVYLRKKVASPVGVSALISLVGALTPFPAVIMAASFAGMSSDQNLSGWRLPTVAVVFAILFSLSFGLVEGVGGWLGFLACVSVFLVVAAEREIVALRNARSAPVSLDRIS